MDRDDSVAPLTMNPYQVLGVAPTASMDEIEAAYRQQLRAHHPDLHQGESPEALAEAEATTRSLNEAMALVRAGWRPLPGTAAGFHYDDRTWGSGGAARSGSRTGGDGRRPRPVRLEQLVPRPIPTRTGSATRSGHGGPRRSTARSAARCSPIR